MPGIGGQASYQKEKWRTFELLLQLRRHVSQVEELERLEHVRGRYALVLFLQRDIVLVPEKLAEEALRRNAEAAAKNAVA